MPFVANHVQIGQIIINLINNAIDSISETNQKGTISVSIIQKRDHIEVIVADSGPGVPEEIAPNIMNPFYTTKEIGKGTGLGLSVSSSLAEAHDGRLYYERRNGVSTFVLFLPNSINSLSTDMAG